MHFKSQNVEVTSQQKENIIAILFAYKGFTIQITKQIVATPQYTRIYFLQRSGQCNAVMLPQKSPLVYVPSPGKEAHFSEAKF